MLTSLRVPREANKSAPILETAHALLWTKRHLLRQFKVNALGVISQFISADDLCLDIGAHAGSWSVKLASLVSKGHVYAFEALPYYSRVLRITLTLLGTQNVTVVPKAVTDGDHEVPLIWRDTGGRLLTGTTHIAGLGEDRGNAVVVDGICLDSFCRDVVVGGQRIRFVKCDVEGAELAVLRGAKEVIDKWRPIFYLEVWREYCERYGYIPDDLFDFLAKKDYQSYILTPSLGLNPVDSVRYEGKGDVLFLPRRSADEDPSRKASPQSEREGGS